MTGVPARVAVVCVGNSLVADDAAGCAVFDRLEARPLPEHVHLHHLGVGGMSLLDLLNGERSLLVVDAVSFGACPGTLHFLSWQDLPRAGTQAVSLHGIGIREAIEVGRIVRPDKMPENVFLLGIEGECFDSFVTEMSPEVRDAVERATQAVLCWVNETGEGRGASTLGSPLRQAMDPAC